MKREEENNYENKNQIVIKSGILEKKTITCAEAHVQLAHGLSYLSPIRFFPTKVSLYFGEKNF